MGIGFVERKKMTCSRSSGRETAHCACELAIFLDTRVGLNNINSSISFVWVFR